jgi:hypothetical protein
VIACASRHLDANRDRRLSRAELQGAVDALPWHKRGAVKVIGGVAAIFAKCDADGDGYIDMRRGGDMDKTTETCLAKCCAWCRPVPTQRIR